MPMDEGSCNSESQSDEFQVYLKNIYAPTVPREFYYQDNLEIMAKLAHKYYIEICTKCDPKKVDEYKDWEKKKEWLRETNIAQVRFIPDQLDSIGYCICKNDGTYDEAEISEDDIEFLSKMEHERWMGEKYSKGYKLAQSENDKTPMCHCDLKPWEKLDSNTREKDKNAVRHYKDLLNACNPSMIICKR